MTDLAAQRGSFTSGTSGGESRASRLEPMKPPRITADGEIRCTAPHPDAPGRECNGFCGEVDPNSPVVEKSAQVAPGCTVVTCPRCRAKYRACPVRDRRVA